MLDSNKYFHNFASGMSAYVLASQNIDRIEPSRQKGTCDLSLSAQKGRLLTLSSTFKSRKFESNKKIRQLSVHVRCIISIPLRYIIISHDVGSLCCLSLLEAMREPESGISEYRLPRHFYLNNLFKAIFGEFYRQVIEIT